MSTPTKFLLPEDKLPEHWYNIAADLPKPMAPVLHPGTMQPVGPDDLAPLFPMELIAQEVSTEREIPIPEPVREVFRLWRPSPLIRAHRLEKALGTPAKIYYKYEGVSPAGSHKPNTAVPQAWYNAQAGVKKLSTETGAGQWGSSLALAGQMFGIDIRIYMVNVSYQQKPFRRSMMQAWGAEVLARAITESFTFARLVGVIAVMKDKDALGVLQALEPVLDDVVVTRTTSPRAMTPRQLGELAAEVFGEQRVTVVEELPDALDVAAGMADADGGVSGGVLATGSVVTAAEVRMLLGTTAV